MGVLGSLLTTGANRLPFCQDTESRGLLGAPGRTTTEPSHNKTAALLSETDVLLRTRLWAESRWCGGSLDKAPVGCHWIVIKEGRWSRFDSVCVFVLSCVPHVPWKSLGCGIVFVKLGG